MVTNDDDVANALAAFGVPRLQYRSFRPREAASPARAPLPASSGPEPSARPDAKAPVVTTLVAPERAPDGSAGRPAESGASLSSIFALLASKAPSTHR